MNHHPAPNAQLVSTFDLRVVAGLHAGARTAIGKLGDDARIVDTLTLGHGTDCDVVLQDPALAEGNLTVRLVRTDDGMVCGWLANLGDPLADEAHTAALGEVMRWGGLGLTVAAQDTPWPSIDIMHEATIAGSAALASEARAAGNAAAKGIPRTTEDTRGNTDAKPDAGSEDEVADLALDDAESHPRGAPTSDDTEEALGATDADAVDSAAPGESDNPLDAPALDTLANADTKADANANSIAPAIENRKGIGPRLRALWRLIPGAVIAAIVSVVVVLALGMLLIRILNGSGSRDTSPRGVPKVAIGNANQPAALVTKVIDKLGLASALHLQTTPDGLVAVVGWVRDDAQRDQLASALAQVDPMPAMLVNLESEAISATQQMVTQYGSLIDVINEGGGKIRVIGLIDDGKDRSPLEATFHSQLPTARLMDDRLLNREQMMAALQSSLIEAGLGRLSVMWTNAGMQIEEKAKAASKGASTTRINGDKLFATVQAFKQQYGMRLPIFAHLDGEQETLQPRVLPFNISAVTGGPLPSVVVDDGTSTAGKQTRLLPGGLYRGYRLVSITPQQVIFDGPQRVVVTR